MAKIIRLLKKFFTYLGIFVIGLAGGVGIVFYWQFRQDYYNSYLVKKENDPVVAKITPSPTITPTPIPLSVPIKIHIPALSIEASVVKVGYNLAKNQVGIPKNALEVGWYDLSPTPGAVGTSILSAHYDTATGRPGIFYNLGKLKPEDELFIINEDGDKLKYIVTLATSFPLDTFPKDLIYGEKDGSNISLITCSGVWDPAKQSYTHRLLVLAHQDLSFKEKISDVGSWPKPEQLAMHGFVEQEQDRANGLAGAYLRLEAKDGKLTVFLATDGQNVNAVDIVLQYDDDLLLLAKDNLAISGKFMSYLVDEPQAGSLVLSLFNDPLFAEKTELNSQNKEVKIAEIPYVLKNSKTTAKIELLTGVDNSAVLTASGEDMHSGENILQSVPLIEIVK